MLKYISCAPFIPLVFSKYKHNLETIFLSKNFVCVFFKEQTDHYFLIEFTANDFINLRSITGADLAFVFVHEKF